MAEKCKYCGSGSLKTMPSEVMQGVYVQCLGCPNSSASAATEVEAIEDWDYHNGNG